VAGMLPKNWDKKLVDMNATSLKDRDIRWADYVFISAMVVQRASALGVIARCHKLGKKIVAGGPLFTTEHDLIQGVDHYVLDEAEITLPPFLDDLSRGTVKPMYTSQTRPELTLTPLPDWSLLNMKHYSSMCIQYSRGCPFNCEFCDIVALYGHAPRTKSKEQVVGELDALYQGGWRGGVFIVDDNFIGNKKKLKAEVLPAIISWMKEHKYPFSLSTEASINLADDEELMNLMADAGFNQVFIGVETPNPESLAECDKSQNEQRDLVAAIQTVQQHGMEVQGGFIIGFDNDPPSIFKNQIEFIQKSGIVTAMVGLLNAPKGTRLYGRLKVEKRLMGEFTGDNTDFSLNFIPRMSPQTLVTGYKNILNELYSPENLYERIATLLKDYRPKTKGGISRLKWSLIQGFYNCIWYIGIAGEGRRYFWKVLVSTLFTRPESLPLFFTLSIYGYHFSRVSRKYKDALIPLAQIKQTIFQ
jgi:radical SAM superfamily enzyme YgiQ (UPF0313 family)